MSRPLFSAQLRQVGLVMKLLKAKFENFRLLRDVEIDFSADPEKNLTVIRAANESGKTTVLLALQWVLYGEEIFLNRGNNFRVSPINYESSGGTSVHVSGSVEFEVTRFNRSRNDTLESTKVYRIVRSASEDVDNPKQRAKSTARLFEVSSDGHTPVDYHERMVKEDLPLELREVFFTDGDRAMSFIESSSAAKTKRERVEGAIRALLGLDLVESGIQHLKKFERKINAQAKKIGKAGELARVSAKIEEIEQSIAAEESLLKESEKRFQNAKSALDKASGEIAKALQKGDRDALASEMKSVKEDRQQANKEASELEKEHSGILRAPSLARNLLARALKPVRDELDNLHREGRIPKATAPVLQERLNADVCICGESLSDELPEGKQRRRHVQKLIDESRQADKVQELITSLYYFATQRGEDVRWLDIYGKVSDRRSNLHKRIELLGQKERSIGVKIDGLGNTDVARLRQQEQAFKDAAFKENGQIAKSRTTLERLREEKSDLEITQAELLKTQSQGKRILALKQVVQDAKSVLEDSLAYITGEEVRKVSEHMNDMFLSMIGVDGALAREGEQQPIIRRAELGGDFGISVYGDSERMLDPENDLNGASRRALTLAFILALTKVSGVVAPNVIDTPLGMTSGLVRQATLKTVIENSHQIVLLLTHDEILGCEKILSERAGKTHTLTNTAHFPTMLAHRVEVDVPQIVQCGCGPVGDCRICQRQTDLS